ncbi:MAG: hypothetical protein KAV18_06230 [Candidatus Omnitrophica bacterium]|nr:hypothetical protein [Candidatus Omnitrophota bacterium]
MKHGGLRVLNPKGISEFESPDCRNEIIAGNRLKTRPGMVKVNTTALPNPINFLLNVKSGFCKENYKLTIDRNGRIMVDPDDTIPIPQKASIVAYWQMENAQVTVAIPQKANIIAYWKMEDSA